VPTDILSRTVSKLSQIIVPILDQKTVTLSLPFWGGVRGNIHCSS